MTEDRAALLLDTCAAIWLGKGERMTDASLAAIRAAADAKALFVSPVSAWEVGLSEATRRAKGLAPPVGPDALTWFRRFLEGPGVRLAPCAPAALVASSRLPGEFHGDPADRLLVATARALGVPIVTRDRKILAYAEAGHVAAVAC